MTDQCGTSSPTDEEIGHMIGTEVLRWRVASGRAVEHATQPVHGELLNTLDALHLASIEFLRSHRQDVTLASYDSRIIAAAQSMSIPLFPFL